MAEFHETHQETDRSLASGLDANQLTSANVDKAFPEIWFFANTTLGVEYSDRYNTEKRWHWPRTRTIVAAAVASSALIASAVGLAKNASEPTETPRQETITTTIPERCYDVAREAVPVDPGNMEEVYSARELEANKCALGEELMN